MVALGEVVVEHADGESTTAKDEKDMQEESNTDATDAFPGCADRGDFEYGEDKKQDEDIVVIDEKEKEEDKDDAEEDETDSLAESNKSHVLAATDKVPQADSTKTWKERLDGLTVAEAYELLRSHGISTPRAGLKYYLDYGYVVLS